MNETLLWSIRNAPEKLKRLWGAGYHSASDIWWYCTVYGTDVWIRKGGPGDDGINELRTVPAGFYFHAVQVPYRGMERGTVDYLLDRGTIVPKAPLSWAREYELPETIEAVEALMKEFEEKRHDEILRHSPGRRFVWGYPIGRSAFARSHAQNSSTGYRTRPFRRM